MYHEIRKRGFSFNQINKLGIISLLASLGTALFTTVWAIYLESYFHNPSYVGFLMTFFAIIAGISYIIIVPIIEADGKTKIYSFSILLFIISYLLFALFPNLIVIVFFGIITAIAASLKTTSFGIITRDKSKDKCVSKNIGLIYTFINFAWLIGPIIAGFLADKYGIRSVFLAAAFFMFLTFILFKIFNIKDNRKNKKIDKNFLKILRDFLKNKDRVLIYLISGGISIWWAMIYIYIPIFIVDSGHADSVVGYFLSLIVIPLVLFEFYFGKLAGKIGSKKMFFIGYISLAILSLICFFLTNFYFILGTLILASVFMAMIEPTSESYFFDLIKKQERDKYYGPYNTTIDVNHSLSTFLIAGILLILPFKFIFIFIALAMLILALISLKIKNIIECKN